MRLHKQYMENPTNEDLKARLVKQAHVVRAQREGQEESVGAATVSKGKRKVMEVSGDQQVVVVAPKKVKVAVGGSDSADVEIQGVGKSGGHEVKKGKRKEATTTVGGKTKKTVGPAPKKTCAGTPGEVDKVLGELMVIMDNFQQSTKIQLELMETLIREQEGVIRAQAERVSEISERFEDELDELDRQNELLSRRVEQLEVDLHHE